VQREGGLDFLGSQDKGQTNFSFNNQEALQFNEALSIQTQNIAVTDECAIVELYVEVGGIPMTVKGWSKRFHGDKVKGISADKPDVDVAVGVALARALREISKRVERQANGRSVHNEKMRLERAGRDKEAAAVLDDLKRLDVQLSNVLLTDNAEAMQRRGVEIYEKIKRNNEELKTLSTQGKKRVNPVIVSLTQRLFKEVFGITEADIDEEIEAATAFNETKRMKSLKKARANHPTSRVTH
jgi:hypothetical protein